MTGYVTTCDGRCFQLPEFLQWNFKMTDGDPCDSFCVQMLHTPQLAELLRISVGFSAEEQGKTVFTGVVDDYEIRLERKGLLAELTGRGMAAVLLDNQVRAAEYLSAQLGDILNNYVRPYGITRIDAENMPPVARFVVETGYTCWQVLAGFCRHSAGIFPRFTEDGTLVLRKQLQGKTVKLRQQQCTQIRLIDSRYGLSSQQILVNTRTGVQTVADNEEFLALGGRCVKVRGHTGDKIRATWRTAEQTMQDAKRDKRLLEVSVPACFAARPLDLAEVSMPELGIAGEFTVQTAESACDESGARCILTLR